MFPARSVPLSWPTSGPDVSCTSLDADWNPVTAADPQSAWVTALAGFVFVCLTIVVADKRIGGRAEAAVLFLSSFISLAIAGYILTVVTGDPACLRGWMGQMIANGPTAVGSAGTLCGIVWLIAAQFGPGSQVTNFAIWSGRLTLLMIIISLASTARQYILDAAKADPTISWIRNATLAYIPVALAIGLAAILSASLTRPPPQITNEKTVRHHELVDTRVSFAGIMALGWTICSLGIYGVLSDHPKSAWARPASWISIVSILLPLLSTEIVLVGLIRSLPRPRRCVPVGRPRTLRIGTDGLCQRLEGHVRVDQDREADLQMVGSPPRMRYRRSWRVRRLRRTPTTR